MQHLSFNQIALLAWLCAVAACSQGTDKTTSDHGGRSTASAASRASAAAPADRAASDGSSDSDDAPITQIDCARIFKPEDTIPILGAPSKISIYTMRDRSCDLETETGEHIVIYGGKGDDLTSKVEWNDASISSDKDRYAKLGGVGDEAYWRKDGLHNSVLSRKGDLWCSANGGTPAKTEGDARKLGELCNKVYASGL